MVRKISKVHIAHIDLQKSVDTSRLKLEIRVLLMSEGRWNCLATISIADFNHEKWDGAILSIDRSTIEWLKSVYPDFIKSNQELFDAGKFIII